MVHGWPLLAPRIREESQLLGAEAVATRWVLGTTGFCLLFALAGHIVVWLAWVHDASKWPWQPIVAMSLTGVALGSFGGFYIASRRARTAIAASFLLTFLVTLTYALSISAFLDLKSEGADELFDDFRTICLAIIAFYFGSEAVITSTKVIQVAHTSGTTAQDIKTADRDLAPPPPKRRD